VRKPVGGPPGFDSKKRGYAQSEPEIPGAGVSGQKGSSLAAKEKDDSKRSKYGEGG